MWPPKPSRSALSSLLLLMVFDAKATEEVEFDPSLLAPSPHAADISHFNKGQTLFAGSYDSDIYLNEQLVACLLYTSPSPRD